MTLQDAIAATMTARWELPIVVGESHYWSGIGRAWDVEEADGTRIAIVGELADADLIAAALNHVLGEITNDQAR